MRPARRAKSGLIIATAIAAPTTSGVIEQSALMRSPERECPSGQSQIAGK